MPMRRPRRTPNHVAGIQPLRPPALVAHPARPRGHAEQLPGLVGVPVGAGARREHDGHDGDGVVAVGAVHVDFTREIGGGRFGGALAGGAGAGDVDHGHCDVLGVFW